jgi:hypothetical protein
MTLQLDCLSSSKNNKFEVTKKKIQLTMPKCQSIFHESQKSGWQADKLNRTLLFFMWLVKLMKYELNHIVKRAEKRACAKKIYKDGQLWEVESMMISVDLPG